MSTSEKILDFCSENFKNTENNRAYFLKDIISHREEYLNELIQISSKIDPLRAVLEIEIQIELYELLLKNLTDKEDEIIDCQNNLANYKKALKAVFNDPDLFLPKNKEIQNTKDVYRLNELSDKMHHKKVYKPVDIGTANFSETEIYYEISKNVEKMKKWDMRKLVIQKTDRLFDRLFPYEFFIVPLSVLAGLLSSHVLNTPLSVFVGMILFFSLNLVCIKEIIRDVDRLIYVVLTECLVNKDIDKKYFDSMTKDIKEECNFENTKKKVLSKFKTLTDRGVGYKNSILKKYNESLHEQLKA